MNPCSTVLFHIVYLGQKKNNKIYERALTKLQAHVKKPGPLFIQKYDYEVCYYLGLTCCDIISRFHTHFPRYPQIPYYLLLSSYLSYLFNLFSSFIFTAGNNFRNIFVYFYVRFKKRQLIKNKFNRFNWCVKKSSYKNLLLIN